VETDVDMRLSIALARIPGLIARTSAAHAVVPKAQLQVSSPQLFLPGSSDSVRAMPNHIARSSLFAPIARGRKVMLKDAILVSRPDAVIKFWGEQLDESQADVWMQVLHEAQRYPLGEPVPIRRAQFLRAIGRHSGSFEYRWLSRTMKVLSFAMLVIEVTKQGRPKSSVGKNRALHMIEGFDFDDETGVYKLRIDPRWCAMFDNREFSLVDWHKRLRFGVHQDMAKALQRLVATSNEPVQRYRIEWLKGKLQYGGRLRDFVIALRRAMAELERLEIVQASDINMSTKGHPQAVWRRL